MPASVRLEDWGCEMKSFRVTGLVMLALCVSVPGTAFAQFSFGAPMMKKKKLKKAIAAAEAHPLGSAKNPVRAEMPGGQRAYLSNLRCADGNAPTFQRRGNIGPGVYRTIVDLYDVDCGTAAPGKVEIIMDMYHPGHFETRPVEGFTITGG